MPIEFDGKPTATHFVMIGTPNMGTPCAWGMDDIIVRIFNRPADAMREITIRNMRDFNRRITNRKGTKFSILVGNAYTPICQMDAPGDGITPNLSAIWTISDFKFSLVRNRHERMLDDQSNFMTVYQWLAISPKGDFAPDTMASLENSLDKNSADLDENFGKSRNYGAMFSLAKLTKNKATADDEQEAPKFSTGVKLAPLTTTEIDIPVVNDSRLAIVFLAPPNISATLINESGAVVGKNLAGSTEAEGTFRTILVNNLVQAGTWKLKLESREQTESEIAIAVFQ